MPPSVEYIISVLSVLKCGEAFLPLDPSWPRDRILSIVDSSNASLIVACGSSFGKSGCEPLDQSHWLFECSSCPVFGFSMGEGIEQHKNRSWPCESERKRLFCYLMYTSGSTGMPKGVCGTEQGQLLSQFLVFSYFAIAFLCEVQSDDATSFTCLRSFKSLSMDARAVSLARRGTFAIQDIDKLCRSSARISCCFSHCLYTGHTSFH